MRKKNKQRVQSHPWEAYCENVSALSDGNGLELLIDGEQAFPSMLDAIGSAERTILMDSYIFSNDEAGELFAEALTERARAGVKVFLIVDGIGTWKVPVEFFDAMQRDGVNVLIYRPVAPWRSHWGLLRRNHRKLLVVDGRVGFAGGLNIGREWLSKDQGGEGWHDIHIRLEGPAVSRLSKLAMATWRNHAQVALSVDEFLPTVKAAGSLFVNVVDSRERKRRKTIRRAYLYAMKNSRNYIYITNAYFLPGRGFRRALRNACKRGVDVRVMVPMKSDIWPVQMASQALYGRLLRSGVKLYLWKNAVLHAKTAVIDDQWATVGSYNIDHRSWNMNLEVNVNTVGPHLATRLKQVFLNDQAGCVQLDRKKWKKRSIAQRMVERFWHLFRKMM